MSETPIDLSKWEYERDDDGLKVVPLEVAQVLQERLSAERSAHEATKAELIKRDEQWGADLDYARREMDRATDASMAQLIREWNAATAELEACRADAERLDFVLKQQAFIYEEPPKMPYPGLFQLWTQDEDENFNVISGDGKWFKTPRDAIDAAMKEPIDENQ